MEIKSSSLMFQSLLKHKKRGEKEKVDQVVGSFNARKFCIQNLWWHQQCGNACLLQAIVLYTGSNTGRNLSSLSSTCLL
jgi:hypothetical protein